MPTDMENKKMASGLEETDIHSHTEEWKRHRLFKLSNNLSQLTHKQDPVEDYTTAIRTFPRTSNTSYTRRTH